MIQGLLEKFFGSYLSKKADLYDGAPDGKPWYRSKTILSGIAVMLRGLYMGVSALLVAAGHSPLPAIPGLVDSILGLFLGAAAIKGRVDANQPIVVSE